ncbi:hypothetical protein [Alteromonas gilva]|uniref:Uncharacterized protein n=1 Tax=Alteromonas gilva TaxID=2987522 RepID=A0ABT5KXX6_9ALTE|nr:hypothetical protein [Alteromonas gilva]MDC8829606.1 hypothetical protein [Alteromonas gilva]
MSLSLRTNLANAIVIACSCCSLTVDAEPIAADEDKFLGNIYSTSQVTDFLDYRNQVTAENAG